MQNVAEMDVLGEVLRLIEKTVKVPADQVDIDANLESFGINSLIGMELMENIENEFDVTITPAQFTNVDTVRALAGLLETLIAEKTAVAAPLPNTAQAASNVQALPNRQQTNTTPLRGLRADDGLAQVLDHVRQKYAIDLKHQDFGSIEDVVETLVSSHTTDLLRHYGLSGQGAYRVSHEGSAAPNPKAKLVAIVGMSCRLPDAPNPQVFWENLVSQKNSMREIPKTRWDWEEYYSETITPGKTVSKWGALIDDVDCFDPHFFNIPAEEAHTLDPQLRLLLEETYHAVEDAGINMKEIAGSRTGIFIGYEYSEYEHHLRKLNNKDFTKGPLFSSSSPSYYLSNRISHTFDLCGPSESFNVNCASSAVAINRAYYSLLNGESDLAVAGAASLNLFADDYIASSQYGVLSPNGTSGVFDDDANGFTRGEGVATVVLKRLEDAEKDNDRIYGVIRASHENYRGTARNISEVKHEAITNVLSACYEKASVDIASIDYIEVDGYANKWADSFEYEGVKGVFAKSEAGKKHVALGSLKGNIGNVESVSGVANVIKIALSLYHKKFPATISKKKVNSFIDIDKTNHPLYIADKEISFDSIRRETDTPIRAGVNSFADSGTNVHILLEEYMPSKQAAVDATQLKQLFVLSAKDAKRLEQFVQQYIEFLSASDLSLSLSDLVYTSQTGREALNERLAIVASSRKELLDKLSMVKRSGIKEKLGLESKEIFGGRVNPAEKNPLASLITADMAHMQLDQSMQTAQWKQVAMLWVNGVSVPWEAIWQKRSAQRVSLPTYPFAKDRYWYEISVQGDAPKYAAVKPGLPDAEETLGDETANLTEELYFFVPRDASAFGGQSAELSRAEKIERFIRQEIAKQLKSVVDDISLDKNFIELGMNSIGVADLIIKVDALLSTNLSPSVIFKYPEVGTLSEYLAGAFAEEIDALVVSNMRPTAGDIREPVAKSEDSLGEHKIQTPLDILIPLQAKGKATPIFAVPGAGGSALSMQPLSHALGDTQPFYCLEPVGLDGKTPVMDTVQRIADFNIEALKSVQAKGPYRLLGYSNGGIVAFEMARRLLDGGEKVSSLIMLDSLSPSLLNNDPTEDMMVAVFRHFVSSLGGASDLTVEQLRSVPEQERAEFLYNTVTHLGIELPKHQFMSTFNVANASELACRAYQPVKLVQKIDIALFRASDGFKGVPHDYGWNDLLSAEIQIQEVEGNHFTILENASAKELAKRINLPAGSRRSR